MSFMTIQIAKGLIYFFIGRTKIIILRFWKHLVVVVSTVLDLW